ncbi:MAG: hypothetical protein LC781_20485 [Actinobacteria bacterium]|nr:hypothetical protein [Actinomycetota bacterium]
MNSNGGGAAGSGKREFYTALALLVMVFVAVGALFAVPAWTQEKQEEEPVSEAQKARIEHLTPEQVEDQFVQVAQASDSSGDLAGDTARGRGPDSDSLIELITIDAASCTIASDATITFDDGDEVGVVVNGDNVRIRSTGSRIEIRAIQTTGDDDIEFFGDELDPGILDILSSSGIDCGDSDDDDGFDDELLFLLLLELLDDDNGNGNGDDGDNGDGDNGDGDGGDIDDADTNGDGVVSQQEREAADAENDLNGEDTDGQYSDEGNDDDGDGVSATSDGDGAEASTPGAFASSGGDPDELAPETSTQGDVVDEIPTSGPLPNTGGVPVAAGTVVALVLFGAGLLVVRLVMIWRGRRA